MAENSSIEWTKHTANLWWGCTEVHAGCDNCYARVFARRVGKADGWDGARYATRAIWKDLVKWDAAARKAGRVDRVFCGSMMDIFEKSLPVADWQGNHQGDAETGQLRERYFREVVPATPNLMHLLLTKRPSNILKMVPAGWPDDWPANVMTGTSPVDQPTADTLVPQLLRVPGPHFLSVEPMLGPVDLTRYFRQLCDHGSVPGPGGVGGVMCPACQGAGKCHGVNWVITGGESGHGARDFNIEWPRSIVQQCRAAGVPVHVKQMGAKPVWTTEDDSEPPHWGRIEFRDKKGGDWSEWPADLRVREFPEVGHG